MPGTATNIDARIKDQTSQRGYDRIINQSQVTIADALGYLFRVRTMGRPLPDGAANALSLWREQIESRSDDSLASLETALDNQARFAKFSRQIIGDLGYGDQLGEDPDAETEEVAEDDEQADAEVEEQAETRTILKTTTPRAAIPTR